MRLEGGCVWLRLLKRIGSRGIVNTWERLQSFWNYPLLKLSSGDSLQTSQLVLVLIVLIAGYFVSKLIEQAIQRRLAGTSVTQDAAYAMQRISFYTLIVIVVMTALNLLNIPLTAFAFVSGAIAIGIGFGAQNIINNFISGWILMLERPVRINDLIELDDNKGVVERIGNRSTRIRRVDGVHILIPNSQLLERKVVNWTLVDYNIRSTVRVGVAYGSPVDLVAKLLDQALREHPEVLDEPPPLVIFEDFADSALIFETYFWAKINSEKDLRILRSDLRFRIDALFREHGIVIAFPQRDVHLNTSSPLEIELVGQKQAHAGD